LHHAIAAAQLAIVKVGSWPAREEWDEMTLQEAERKREPTLDTLEVVLSDGQLSSNRDRHLCQKVLAQVARRITQDALQKSGWRLSGGQYRMRSGGVAVRARVTRLGTHLAITWTDRTGRQVLLRQSIPITSLPELYEGSLVARARLIGVFLAGALITPITEDAVQHSHLGHQLSELGSKMIDSVEDVAMTAARSALLDLAVEGELHRHGTTLQIILPDSSPPLREEDGEDASPAPSKRRGAAKPTGRRSR
jgi:hypothetical protein